MSGIMGLCISAFGDFWISGFMDFWVYGRMGVWMYGFLDVWVRCLDLWLPGFRGCMDVRISGIMALGLELGLWISRFLDLGIPGWISGFQFF